VITNFDKAIVAMLGAIVFGAMQAGVPVPEWMDTQWVQALAATLTPILVWLIPNKDKPSV
jgi:hypothetical protein|tara:strand:+ start:702 stop:881 length:180 start_codon:yes stop_codon:yes gene_type:complete